MGITTRTTFLFGPTFMIGLTQIVIAYFVWFLKVKYVLVKSFFEPGYRCPLSYLVMDGAGNKWKTNVEIMNERLYEICQCGKVQFSV